MKHLITGLTLIAVIFGCSQIAANCTPPPASQIITLENVACQEAQQIPNEPTWLQYLCTVATGGTVEVKVPASQQSAFEAAHKIIKRPDASTAIK